VKISCTCLLKDRRGNEKRSTNATQLENYDYIVVGSGAGGGPLAARLAIYGKKVLVLEAGDDQGASPQESIPAFYAASSEYAPMSWDFFVRHYSNDTREALNNKATYETPTGETYIGLDPPAGSTLKGIWYPRAGTLGGCGAHNAMVTVYPHEEDWTLIEYLTGDSSWAPSNMRQYFERLEKNEYLTNFTDSTASGHGFNGWLGTDEMHLGLSAADPQILDMISATNKVLNGPSTADITNLAELENAFPLDMNTDYPDRDSTEAMYRIPMAVSDGARSSPRDFLLATANATYANGTKKYHWTFELMHLLLRSGLVTQLVHQEQLALTFSTVKAFTALTLALVATLALPALSMQPTRSSFRQALSTLLRS
jgi:choline dehydrogenase